jgi:hypothetical protein
MLTMYILGGALVIFSFAMMGVQFYSMAQEQKAFEAAQAKTLRIRREQQLARQQEQTKQTDAALGIKN